MKKNRNTRIIGKNVVLVPYKEKHVPRYHEWMSSLELQHLTASEPLTLEEEYKMQKTWLEDENKCTFIVLDKDTFQTTMDEVESMIGDTNLFFNDPADSSIAEVEIMIADIKHRGKKKGWETIVLMLCYGIDVLKVTKYRAKVTLDNGSSRNMFKKLGFHEISRSEVFQEVTYERETSNAWVDWLHLEIADSIKDELYNIE